jgi:hypothetical protein
MRPVGRGDVIDDDLLGAAESGPLAKVGRHYQEHQYPAMRVPRLPTDVRGGNPLSETLEDVRQRSMELAIDWPLPSPMPVLVFRAGEQALELGAWPTGSVDLMYRLYGDDSPMPLTNPPLPGVF